MGYHMRTEYFIDPTATLQSCVFRSP